ncbi:MAG: nucleotidyltransferase substrate binding protein [Mariprofundaceae bacterium]|nr:nucleotidyltransferase substrate binding protein [Mariprofundaceae bacterium]
MHTSNQDIRWIQRFDNFCRALNQLTKFMQQESLNELEEQGLIKAFEYNFELGWKVLKDLLEYQGITGLIGSRDAIREAFKQGLLADEVLAQVWMEMIKSRNLAAHAYDEAKMQEIVTATKNNYFPAFVALRQRLQGLIDDEEG